MKSKIVKVIDFPKELKECLDIETEAGIKITSYSPDSISFKNSKEKQWTANSKLLILADGSIEFINSKLYDKLFSGIS
jgi:hypothetical protein